MLASKLTLDSASTQLLKTLKFRTGLTHQYLCRLALCLSLEESEVIDPAAYDDKGLEFNRYTLTGEHDAVLVACVREWIALHVDVDPKAETGATVDEALWFRAHINRGLALLPKRVKTLDRIADLIPVPTAA